MRAAKNRARQYSINFSLQVEDIVIPEYCPILKIKLERKFGQPAGHDASPSLDRIIPELGYIKGNVQVISRKANAMKSNATKKELKLFAEWVNSNYD